MPKPYEPFFKEGVWTVDFTYEGRRVRKRLGLRDRSLKAVAREKAKQLYDEVVAEHLEGPRKPGNPFWKAAKGYVDAGGEPRFLPPIMQYFGEGTMIEDINEAEIVACEMTLYPNAAPATKRRQVRVPINAVLRWHSGKRRMPSVDVKRTRWLMPEEMERLIEAADDHLLPKIAFLIGSGCRTGEMVALDASDFNRETQQAWISGEEAGAGKTETSTRWVRLPDRSVELMGDVPEDGKLFRTPKGLPYKLREKGGGQIQAAFNKARDKAGLESDGPRKVTPHVLRHTWATWYYAQTKDFGGLMDLGGWAKSDMANRYRKLAPDDLAGKLLDFGWDFRQKSVNSDTRPFLRVVKQ